MVRPIFEQWFAALKDLTPGVITIRNTGGTDHQSYDAVGLPGFQFIQDPMDYDTRTHHSNMDVYDRIQQADMEQMAIIEAVFRLQRGDAAGETAAQGSASAASGPRWTWRARKLVQQGRYGTPTAPTSFQLERSRRFYRLQ